MARPKITEGERLQRVAEKISDCAQAWDGSAASLHQRRQLHDDLEIALNEGRTIVRGRGFQ